jgi:Cu-Zn family superoxide dismutase
MTLTRHFSLNRLGMLALVVAAIVAAVGVLQRPAAAGNKGDEAKVQLHNAAGVVVGDAKFDQERNGVEVRVKVRGLTPGFHGFHIHTTGSCVAPDFTSAGGHFNPTGEGHGHHAGDMPILHVNPDGAGEARFTIASFQVGQLFDADGSALIVHAGPDNYANIPQRYAAPGPDGSTPAPGPDGTTLATGDSGARVACGAIQLDD